MIYVFYSLLQKSFLRREVNKITKNVLGEVNDFNFVKLDAKENSVDEIVNACIEVPMLEDKKVVVVNDAFFLAKSKGKEKNSNEYLRLINYLKKPIEETDLIFLVYDDVLNTRSPIYKAMEKKAQFANFAPLKEGEWSKYCSSLCQKKGLKIDFNANKELAKRTLNDRDSLLNEIDKLSLYTDHVTINDVLTLVSAPLEDKVYTLSNALLNGDIVEALFIYKDLITKSNDPTNLISMLMNQFRLMFRVLYLHQTKKSVLEIASEYKMHEYRIQSSLNSAKKLRIAILTILDDLYLLDYKIKSAQIDRFLALELFIINFKNKYF